MRIFAGEWVRDLFKRMGMGNGEAIESPYVSKRISGAQKKVEERNLKSVKTSSNTTRLWIINAKEFTATDRISWRGLAVAIWS